MVSDYEMPQKDGLQFLKEFHEQNYEIPFILFTGKGREEVAIKALNLGADGYFNKQGNPETVYGELAFGILQSVQKNRVEMALLLSEKKFRIYVSDSPVAFFVVNKDGKYVEVNKAACSLLGYSKDELLELSIANLLFEEDLTFGLKQFGLLQEKGKARFEVALKKKDGYPVYVILNATKLPDGKMMSFCENITENKINEAKQRQSEEQYKQLFSNMPSAVAVYEAVDGGKDFVFMDFNTAAEKIEKISKKNVVGKRVSEVFAGVVSFGIFSVFQRVYQSGKPEYYPEALYKDDKHLAVWRENWVYKLPNGNIVAIYNDITERKKTEDTLRLSETKFRHLTDSLPEVVFETDRNGKLLYANSVAFEIFRYTQKDFEKGLYVFNFVHKKDHQRAKETFGKALANVFSNNNEYICVRKDGSSFPAMIVSRPIIEESKPIGLRGLVIDLTQRKKVTLRVDNKSGLTIAD